MCSFSLLIVWTLKVNDDEGAQKVRKCNAHYFATFVRGKFNIISIFLKSHLIIFASFSSEWLCNYSWIIFFCSK